MPMPTDINALIDYSTSGGDPTVDATLTQESVQGVNVYLFMDHAEAGRGGFRDGTYLIAHSREMFYASRKAMCFYKNFVRPILRAMLEPIFNKTVTHTVTNPDSGKPIEQEMLFSGFLDDADGQEHTLQHYVEGACSIGRRHGLVFTVVDNFSAEAQPPTVAQAKELRMYPYVYAKKAYDVKRFTLDEKGNLETIMFTARDDPSDKKNPKRWRLWTPFFSVLMKMKVDENGEAVKDSFEEAEGPKEHNLGVVPVIVTYFVKRENIDDLFVDPPLYDLAKVNHAIFNMDSEIRSLERDQGFSIFYMQGGEGNITLSGKNVLHIPIDEGIKIAPGFASPDANILTGLVSNRKELRAELFMIAEQSGVTGVQPSASGIAKMWDFFAHESVLQKTSSEAVALTKQIGVLFGLYVESEPPFDVVADYPTDFQPNDVAAEIKLYQDYLDLEPGIQGEALAKIKASRLVFADEPQEKLDAVEEDIEQGAKDATEQGGADGENMKAAVAIVGKLVAAGVIDEAGAVLRKPGEPEPVPPPEPEE